MGRTLGRALERVQNAQEGFNKVVRADLLDLQRMHFTRAQALRAAQKMRNCDREDCRSSENLYFERRARPGKSVRLG